MFKILDDLMEDPLGTVAKTAIQPIADGLDVLEGLTEGEIREKAAIRLGADVVAGMALSEVIEALTED